MVDTTDEWIVTRTGIRERRLTGDDENRCYNGPPGTTERTGYGGYSCPVISI